MGGCRSLGLDFSVFSHRLTRRVTFMCKGLNRHFLKKVLEGVSAPLSPVWWSSIGKGLRLQPRQQDFFKTCPSSRRAREERETVLEMAWHR